MGYKHIQQLIVVDAYVLVPSTLHPFFRSDPLPRTTTINLFYPWLLCTTLCSFSIWEMTQPTPCSYVPSVSMIRLCIPLWHTHSKVHTLDGNHHWRMTLHLLQHVIQPHPPFLCLFLLPFHLVSFHQISRPFPTSSRPLSPFISFSCPFRTPYWSN